MDPRSARHIPVSVLPLLSRGYKQNPLCRTVPQTASHSLVKTPSNLNRQRFVVLGSLNDNIMWSPANVSNRRFKLLAKAFANQAFLPAHPAGTGHIHRQ